MCLSAMMSRSSMKKRVLPPDYAVSETWLWGFGYLIAVRGYKTRNGRLDNSQARKTKLRC